MTFFLCFKWPNFRGCWWPPFESSKRSRLEEAGYIYIYVYYIIISIFDNILEEKRQTNQPPSKFNKFSKNLVLAWFTSFTILCKGVFHEFKHHHPKRSFHHFFYWWLTSRGQKPQPSTTTFKINTNFSSKLRVSSKLHFSRRGQPMYMCGRWGLER